MAEVKWLNDREQRAWRSLTAMQEGLSEFIDRQLRRRCGLSSSDFRVLAHLSEAPDGQLRPYELTQLLHWEKSRLSQHLSRMQSRGMVSRGRCPDDQRGAVITITGHGRDLIDDAAPQHLADVRTAVIDHLTETELALFATIGDKVKQRLAELNREPGSAPELAEHRNV